MLKPAPTVALSDLNTTTYTGFASYLADVALHSSLKDKGYYWLHVYVRVDFRTLLANLQNLVVI